MNQFRVLLIGMFTAVALYTSVTVATHGPDLLPVFFGAIGKFAWPGQFNLDFMGMLALCAIWVAWRHRFSAVGLGLAALAFFGGTGFLCVYLFIISLRAKGGMSEVMLGRTRATARS